MQNIIQYSWQSATYKSWLKVRLFAEPSKDDLNDSNLPTAPTRINSYTEHQQTAPNIIHTEAMKLENVSIKCEHKSDKMIVIPQDNEKYSRSNTSQLNIPEEVRNWTVRSETRDLFDFLCKMRHSSMIRVRYIPFYWVSGRIYSSHNYQVPLNQFITI